MLRRNLEIDFVVNRHDERLYIQSAYALPDKEKVEQEQASLLNVNDGFRKLIIVGDRYRSGYNEEGILMMSLPDFLLGKEQIVLKKISRAEELLLIQVVVLPLFAFVSEYFAYMLPFLPTYLKCAFLPKNHINGNFQLLP